MRIDHPLSKSSSSCFKQYALCESDCNVRIHVDDDLQFIMTELFSLVKVKYRNIK